MSEALFGAAIGAGGILIGLVLGLFGMNAAYRNGVVDGYGYSREPSCHGYMWAGRFLKKTMAHRWPELKE